MITRHPGVGGLLFAQSQVAFNDNAIKLVLIGLVQMLLPPDQASAWVSAIALLLVMPFLLIAPVTGWLADRFPHRDVLMGSLWLQFGIMALLFAGTMLHSLTLAIGGFFLLGLQSALMSPARRGMVKDLAGDNVGEVIGWMEMLCIAAILAGSLAGGQLIDGYAALLHSPWLAASVACTILGAGCLLAILAFRTAPRHPAATNTPFSRRILFGHIELFRTLYKHPRLWRAAWGDSMFYLAGGMLMLILAQVGRTLHPDGLGAARSTGIMLALVGVGIAAGSITAARMSRFAINMGLVPVGAAGIAVALVTLGLVPAGGAAFHILLVALGVSGGLFLVPLGAFLVDRAPKTERGQILAASSMLSSITGIVAVGVHALLAQVFKFNITAEFVVIALLMLTVAGVSLKFLSNDFLRLVALMLSRQHYTVKAVGADALPRTGGALLVCNHVTYVDTIILSLASPRPIRFLSHDGLFRVPILGFLLQVFGTIPVSSTRAKEAIIRAAEHINNGDIVCIFPEGELTRTGSIMELKGGFELIARRTECPLVVAHMDGLWGSIFSFERGRYFSKWPNTLRRHATVSFARAQAGAKAAEVREIMHGLGATAFAHRRIPSLPQGLFQVLRSAPRRICLHEAGRKPVRATSILAASLALARRWSQTTSDRRIGIILPPGLAGTVANLAALFAGRVPVNLNPTLSPQSATACLMQAGIETIVTAAPIQRKLTRYPWPNRTLLIENELARLSKWQLFRALLSRPELKADPDAEALLLFTSGSSGLPKGVALTHRNIVRNLTQVSETGFLQPDDRVLTALPLFHSFGLSMGLFLPLLSGRPIIAVTSPLESDKITEASRQESPTLLLGTPTFLGSYIKRIPRDAFGTLRLAVTGAEKLRPELAAAFRDRFGCEVVEGYGLTESSPVAAINMPNPKRGIGADSVQLGWRPGSVGRFVPGLAYRLLDPDTQLHNPGATSGILALRGANIVGRYLKGEDAAKFHDGWFITGDIARLDPEGFLFIEGRQSRFSKIGGEMVSHTAVEDVLVRHLPASTDGPAYCVLGRPSDDKGEELILLTTTKVTREELLTAFKAASAPNLWLPREIVRTDRLPILGSGKLDLAACRHLVETSLLA